jgi:hypothetical protein
MATITPLTPPPLNLPESSSTVTLHAINCTLDMYCKTAPFLTPTIAGHEFINFPTLAFLITHPTLNRKVLFDVGGRKDYWNYSPKTKGLLKAASAGMRVDKGVDEILVDAGVALETLNEIVWR